jgi:hypothetical protein
MLKGFKKAAFEQALRFLASGIRGPSGPLLLGVYLAVLGAAVVLANLAFGIDLSKFISIPVEIIQ